MERSLAHKLSMIFATSICFESVLIYIRDYLNSRQIIFSLFEAISVLNNKLRTTQERCLYHRRILNMFYDSIWFRRCKQISKSNVSLARSSITKNLALSTRIRNCRCVNWRLHVPFLRWNLKIRRLKHNNKLQTLKLISKVTPLQVLLS